MRASGYTASVPLKKLGQTSGFALVTFRQLTYKSVKLVHIYSMGGPQHAPTLSSNIQRSRSHGYKSCHDCMVANEVCCCWCGTACWYDCL